MMDPTSRMGLKTLIPLLFIALTITARVQSSAQTLPKPQKEVEKTASSLCSRANGLETIRQQVATSKLVNDVSQQISVMLRSADLFWVWDQSTARSIFKQALEIAKEDYQERSEKQGTTSGSAFTDLRYKVIAAIAKRDFNWSRKISDELLKDQERRSADGPGTSSEQSAVTAERLLSVALSIMPSDHPSAIGFATASLRYPATSYLPIFLYKLYSVDKSAADQFYQQALSVYSESPMNQFLFLSSYAFGNDREAGEMPNWTVYTVPATYKPNPNLQRLFIRTLLRRARLMVENPSGAASGARFSDTEQAWLALTRLKTQIDQSVPEVSEEVESVRGTLFGTNSQTGQLRLTNVTTSQPKKSFAESIEQAQQLPDPARREQQLALLVLRSKDEPLQQVLDAVGQIEDTDLRENLFSWVYFERAQRMVTEDWRQAQTFADKVRELDLRAYLFSKIAEQSIKHTKLDADGRLLLESVLTAAAKAPDTEIKARALLGIAYLYSQIDANRSIAVLNDAVKCINKIESPDFSEDYIERKIKGKTFTSYAILHTPGFNPQNSFREIAKVDFDGAFVLATSLNQKYLRSMMTLVLAEQCLQTVEPVQSKRSVQ